MTIDTRISKSIKQLQIHYSMLMGPEAIGMYYRMLWFRETSINKKIDLDYLKSQTMAIHWPGVEVLIKKLTAFDLLKKTKEIVGDKPSWLFDIKNPKNLTADQKREAVFKMYKYVAITKEEHDALIKYINETGDPEMTEEEAVDVIEESSQDEDFEKAKKKINPDSGIGLVIYYYKALSKAFGGRYLSRNIRMESANLKSCMAKNGDTPEKTREYFDWIIQKNKRENRFGRVSSLGLYPEHRKEAFYALDIQRQGHKKFEEKVEDIPKEDKMINNMKGVHALYMQDGMTSEEAIDKMREDFSEDAIKKFTELLNV